MTKAELIEALKDFSDDIIIKASNNNLHESFIPMVICDVKHFRGFKVDIEDKKIINEEHYICLFHKPCKRK